MAPENAGGEPTSVVEKVSRAFVSRAIYGLVTVLAVRQVMELHPPTAWQGAVSLFGTTLAVALVDAYADSIAEMLAHGRSLTWGEVRAIVRDVEPILVGAQGPTVIGLSALGLFDVEDAIDLA